MAEEQDSAELLALKRHDRAAWANVYDRYVRDVYGFIFHLTAGNRTVAEDLSQETWLDAVRGVHRFDASRGAFRDWIFGIARNKVADHYRRSKAATHVPLSGDNDPGAAMWEIVGPEHDATEHEERLALLRAALCVLPEDRREVLLDKYVRSLSYEEIAVRHGRTPKAIESLLSRAREQMRDLMQEYLACRDPDVRLRGNPCDERAKP